MLRSTPLNYFFLLLIVILFLDRSQGFWIQTKRHLHQTKLILKAKIPHSSQQQPVTRRVTSDLSEDEEKVKLQGLNKNLLNSINKLCHPLKVEELELHWRNMQKKRRDQNERDRKNGIGKKISSKYKKGSLERAVVIFQVRRNGTGFPLPADDLRQRKHWDSQQSIFKSLRTILFRNDSSGEMLISQRVSYMERQGRTKDQLVANNAERVKKVSATNMGHDQYHCRGINCHCLLFAFV